MPGTAVLAILLLVGIFAHSGLIVVSSFIILVLKLLRLNWLTSFLGKKGLEIGLLFLLLAILVPLADSGMTSNALLAGLFSFPGMVALAGGAFATHLNGEGIKLMEMDPSIILGLVTGSIFGVVFLRGIPVGPLTAAGISVLLLESSGLLKH